MKVLYNQIQALVPGLKAGPKEVGEALTLAGFMMDECTEISYDGHADHLIGLEVRQNRADCLSVIGVAREVAAWYGLRVEEPVVHELLKNNRKLDIKIEATQYVKRVSAIRIEGVTNGESPSWLKEFVTHYGFNSINVLVDLSNYVMVLTGYASHLIDAKKVAGQIRWSLNKDFDTMTTLMGTDVHLDKKGDELIICDEGNIIALAGIVGGKSAEIDMYTDDMIVEVAVYDRSIIRRNSRSLNVVTEASHRLEKELDPNGALAAFKLLISEIQKYAGGKISSELFDYYPKKYISPTIEFNFDLPSTVAGIEISQEQSLKIFDSLNFKVQRSGIGALVTPPTYRQDLWLPEDLVEEVIRMVGYDKIPTNEIPSAQIVQDITPPNIVVAEKMRDILCANGYDEVLSWPLTKSKDNAEANYYDWKVISTQNSVNDVYPDLRQSMSAGLLIQFNEYDKKNVEYIKIFEIGKVFGEKGGEYMEYEALGGMISNKKNSLFECKNIVEILLRSLGSENVLYTDAVSKPVLANPHSCWDIITHEVCVGIMYKLASQETSLHLYTFEINITQITALLENVKNNPVVEITQKLICLDANILLETGESILKYIHGLEKKIDKNKLWSLSVTDVYPIGEKVRYTVRAVYKELSDQEAKKIHIGVFNLS